MLVFVSIRALPGDPALALAGEERDPESPAQIRLTQALDDAPRAPLVATRFGQQRLDALPQPVRHDPRRPLTTPT
ncbi:hypothetical protein [Micromonospora cremea]|uniref:Uncharacterized protein n=1 Tax=Micromonospora cremea TaxID=709881 RepID=A0A1N5TWS6_9ACTN|nr:hypothetical protein [Micromonospora cremea]SIM52860.1 hypothetical protein SAMN04489832_0429 [Micromonospora cremea]